MEDCLLQTTQFVFEKKNALKIVFNIEISFVFQFNNAKSYSFLDAVG